MFSFTEFIRFLFLYQLHLTIVHSDDPCFIRDTCTNSSLTSHSIYDDELSIQARNCFCDSVCDKYGDCCGSSNITSTDYECVDYLAPTISLDVPSTNRLSVWMRSECLIGYIGSPIDHQCRNLNNETFDTNPVLFLPVTNSLSNITYRNYYCARCNNDANRENLQFWQYKTFCRGNEYDGDYLTLISQEQVDYYIHNLTKSCTKTIVYPQNDTDLQPSVFIRPCKKSFPPLCPPETSVELARNCSTAGTAYRYIPNSNIIYPNEYCARCNQGNQTGELTCLDPHIRSSSTTMVQIRVNPLSILFDPNLLNSYWSNDIIPRKIYSKYYNCTHSNEMYDLFEKKCSEITNSSEEFIISMHCLFPAQTVIQSDDQIYLNNGSLYLVNYSILLTKDDYVFISDKSIVFCTDRWTNSNVSPTNQPTFPLYRNILSIVGNSISLLCLLVFITIYCLISSLHNLPGKCLLCLSISLFLGQLTFLLSSLLMEYTSFCFASAILIHYFYLSSFAWLLIIAVRVHSTFHQKTILKEQIHSKTSRLILYNILVGCSTGLIIAVACIIQFLIPQSDFSPGYGLVFCSISKVNSMIIFFLIPIGCVLLSVMILFVRTLLTIYRSHQIAKLAYDATVSTAKDKRLTFIYARLASLMGIQWILLILALAIQQTWSWILFEITNSLPGFFICLGFLCSKRIFKELKQKVPQKLTSIRSSSTSTSKVS